MVVATPRLRWGDIPAEHRRWLFLNALLLSAVINFGINAVIAWISLRGARSVPLWDVPLVGKTSTALDTVGTFFFLPFMTTLFCTTAVWAQVRGGRLAPLSKAPFFDRLPQGRVRRGLVLGGVCVAALSPIALVVFVLARVDTMSAGAFVLYKGVLGVVLGLLVTPVIALCAMADIPSPTADDGR
jgi:hypothetical protein